MRFVIIISFIFLSSNVFSQTYNFSTIISRKFEKAEKIALMNENDTILLFKRCGNTNLIQSNGENFLLKKRKVLFDSNNDTIAFYKRKYIILPKKNIIVNEKKSKNGWEYFIDNKKVLSIRYKFNKNDNNYIINIESNDLNQTILNIMQISLGRFDKRVVMDYNNDDNFSTALIIAIIVAL